MTTISIRIKSGHPADEFGRIKAMQAKLAKREKELKDAILRLSKPVAGEKFRRCEGNLFRVTVAPSDGSETLDRDKVRSLLSATAFISCIKTGKPSIKFRAVARSAARIAEEEVA